MAMSPTNSPSSSVPANTSSNGPVTDEVTMGEVNTSKTPAFENVLLFLVAMDKKRNRRTFSARS